MKKIITLFIICCLSFNNILVFAQSDTKFPDYAYEFLGEDKWENFNRKMFNFNRGLNKYAIRPLHTIWASVMPEYGMDRINGITNNIEYPIRLISSLIQKDFQTSKNETIRFFTNTILGLGGMFDPAKHIFKIEQSKENMEQALAKCNIKPGPYFVAPVFSFTSLRGLFGKALDTALNPSSYIGSPLLAMIKAGLMVNRTSYIQPLLQMVESTYADPYEITKKAFGIDNYIKQTNKDRVDVLSNLHVDTKDELVAKSDTPAQKKPISDKPVQAYKKENLVQIEVSSELVTPNLLYGGANLDDVLKPDYGIEDFKPDADIKLKGYNPQSPVIDSMRTALFALPGVDDSIWNELSIWNRSFSKRIKTSYINLSEGREDYKFRYILQKDKLNAPLVIIFPSIGEGVMASHPVSFAKLFYDAGYSVVIQGSHFQWEFVKSMPKGYHPGLPAKDAQVLRMVSAKIINQLQAKYGCEFRQKIIFGTSFGALTSLFIGAAEYKNNTLGNTKYISICPPVDLIYAMKQVDKYSQEWDKSSSDLKEKVSQTAAKVVKLYQSKDDIDVEINNLPFSEEEAKLITGFIMHQKLSDLIFTIEGGITEQNKDLYAKINNMGYQDYAKKYLAQNNETVDDLSYETGLISISYYLENADNYKIYHSLNDYLTNLNQLKNLKKYSGDKMVLLDNGAHLGFTYRQEFIADLKNTIAKK